MHRSLARVCAFFLAFLFSLIAWAQGGSCFGASLFGSYAFGAGSCSAEIVPIPFMPLWATITLAVALWVMVYLMRAKEA